jgi:TRAP-type mannitol/chloroaromatic compound transport system permease small subunit
MKQLTQIRTFLETASRYLTLVTGYMLLAAALLVCFEVIVRRLFNISLAGADELSGYALAAATSGALSYALFTQSHIRIDALYRLFPLRMKAALDVLAGLSFILLAGLLAYMGTAEMVESATYHAVASTPWRTPLWIPQLVWAIGLNFFALAAVVVTLEAAVRLIAGDAAGAHAIAGISEEPVE